MESVGKSGCERPLQDSERRGRATIYWFELVFVNRRSSFDEDHNHKETSGAVKTPEA